MLFQKIYLKEPQGKMLLYVGLPISHSYRLLVDRPLGRAPLVSTVAATK